MARRFYSDKSGDRLAPIDLTTLRINRGSPLVALFPSGEIHLSGAEAIDLAEAFFGRQRPPGTVAPTDADLDRDATARDLQALRVDALARGTPAGTTAPPKGRGRRAKPA